MILTVSVHPAVDRAYRVDGFHTGGLYAGPSHTVAAGGKANNVARALAALGEPVLATGLAGGAAGQFIVADLQRCGVHTDFLTVPGESRTCVAVVDGRAERVTALREAGPPLPGWAPAHLEQHFARRVRGARLAVVAGSLPPGAPPDLFRTLVAAARAAGVPVFLDTHGPAFTAALAAGPDLVKPNLEELSAWAGRPLTAEAEQRRAALALLSAGARQVVVSLGPDGALAALRSGAGAPLRWLRAQPPRVRALNPIGSGDCLVAGLAAGQLRGLPPAEALRLGVACGTANAETVGVAEMQPDRIDKIMQQVRVYEPVAL